MENRVLPAGPAVADVMANAAFYYGLVGALAEAQRPIWAQMPFAAAAENLREAAARATAPRLMTQRHIEHMHTNQPVHTWPASP